MASVMMVKVLYGCIACCYCANRMAPLAEGVLTPRDMAVLNYNGCAVLRGNRLTNASRKCIKYEELNLQLNT